MVATSPIPAHGQRARVSPLRLTETQIFEFREAFQLFDKDGDGHVTLKELKVVFLTLGQMPSDEELMDMIREVDNDGNDTIEFEEFCALMVKNMNQKDDESTLIEAFSILDEDSSGSIERSELRAMMKNFSKATEEIDDTEIDALLQEADTDGDGQISFEEFTKAMMSEENAHADQAAESPKAKSPKWRRGKR